MRTIKIGPNDAGQRLDKFIGKALPSIPQSLMYKFIRTKKIKVNRKRAEPQTVLNEGDELSLFIGEDLFPPQDGKHDVSGFIENIVPKLDVLYEDGNILLLNKRPGILVHEDKEGNTNTLSSHLKAYLYRKGEYDPASENSFAPALCNRIDRNTGGIVVAAKNAAALREMNRLIKEGRLSKYYICAVHGIPRPEEGLLRSYLRKDSERNTVDISDRPRDGYLEIRTGYRTLAKRDGNSLLEIRLYTGRTHQIRAQMAHIGHPLLGDGKYGVINCDKKKGYRYQALWSYRVVFDFGSDGGVLGYLSGREYSVDPAGIWFCADFGYPGGGDDRHER